MQLSNKQSQPSHFNDYVVNSPKAQANLLHQRCLSPNSIYYQHSGLSRKKLTVISRDTSRPDFKGDYHMPQNGSSFSSSNRTRLQNLNYSPLRTIQSSHDTTQNTIKHYESLKNSRVIKSKLKRPISPSPMTPTKILKLKRSMLNEKNQQSLSTNRVNQQRQFSGQGSLSRRNFQSNQVSPMKLQIQNSQRRMLSARTDIQSPQQTMRQPLPSSNMDNMRNQLMSIFHTKALQLQSRMHFQQETIKILQNKINENNKKLKEKQKLIEELLNRDRSKTMLVNYQQQQKSHYVSFNGKQISGNKSIENENYLLKRIKDVQIKFIQIMKDQQKLNNTQHLINHKISTLQCEIITFNSAKLNAIKNQLIQFLQQKSNMLSTLNQSISYIDNKLIGRTQAIKELMCQLKQKVKEVQDTWTNKQTKTTKQSTTLGLRQSQDLSVARNMNVRRVQNRLKQLTSNEDKRAIKNTPATVQGSLEFSLTSYDQDLNRANNIKNVYYDYNEMSDVSIGLQNFVKDESSRLTDDFYYPGGTISSSSRHASRTISPIINKKQQQSEQYYDNNGFEMKLCKDQDSNKFMKKPEQKDRVSSPINKTKSNINSKNQNQSSPTSQTTIKISHQTINKKIQCIQQLIQTKKTTSCQQIEKGQLRCYVDKTGYLKYTDSKTFVFDKKGNLIPCTEGQFWFLVTKGLIYGKRDDDNSQTVSFIQLDD